MRFPVSAKKKNMDPKAYNLGKCPICDQVAAFIDSKKDAICQSLTPCDSNESYTCYTGDTPAQRFVARKKNIHKYQFPKH